MARVMGNVIEWTPEKLKEFKSVYAEALLKKDSDMFKFEGHPILKTYAAYLIQYLDNYFSKTAS